MVILTSETVNRWLNDCESFCLDFMRYSFEWHHAVGVDIDLLPSEIESAHSEWAAVVREWQNQKFRSETESLSYTKIFGILLWALCQRAYVGELRAYQSFRQGPPKFQGTEELRLELLADLAGAPEVVTALQFCVSILNFYETKRIDKSTPFEFRMTESARHDLIVMLSARECTAVSTYLALEAFYARD